MVTMHFKLDEEKVNQSKYTKANHQIQSFLTQNGFEYYPQSATYESF
jgi:hypothetical protein